MADEGLIWVKLLVCNACEVREWKPVEDNDNSCWMCGGEAQVKSNATKQVPAS